MTFFSSAETLVSNEVIGVHLRVLKSFATHAPRPTLPFLEPATHKGSCYTMFTFLFAVLKSSHCFGDNPLTAGELLYLKGVL